MLRSSRWSNRIVGHADVDPAELVPHPLKYRTHPRLQRAALSGTLEQVGWIAEVIVNRRTGCVVDGHLRVEMACERREPTVPVAYIDLSDDEERMALATFDPIGALAGTDPRSFAALLADLHPGNDAIEALFAAVSLGLEAGAALPGDPDAVPDMAPEPVSRAGDVWRFGADHRLLCGDATDRDVVQKLFGEERASWLWTDPPYGVQYTGKDRAALSMVNDTQRGLGALLVAAFTAANDILQDRSAIYVAHPAGAQASVFMDAFGTVGWPIHQTLIWVKDDFVLGHSDFHYRHEPVLYGSKNGRARWYARRDVDSVFEIARPRQNDGHPTIKPVELVQRHLACSSRQGQLGFDPFAGSGTTIIAAETLQRRCYAMEIDPRYVDVAARRVERYMGAAAILEGDGRNFAEIAEARRGR